MAYAKRRYRKKSYRKKKRVYRKTRNYKPRRARGVYRRKGYRKKSYRRKVRRYVKKRRSSGRRVRRHKQYYSSLVPKVEKSALRITRKLYSTAFISYFQPCLAQPDLHRQEQHNLYALLAKHSISTNFNIIACLLSGIPYAKYRDMTDNVKAIIRNFLELAQHRLVQYKFQQLIPGAHLEHRLLVKQIKEAELANVVKALEPRVIQEMSTVRSRNADGYQKVLRDLAHANSTPQRAIALGWNSATLGSTSANANSSMESK